MEVQEVLWSNHSKGIPSKSCQIKLRGITIIIGGFWWWIWYLFQGPQIIGRNILTIRGT